MTNVKYLCDHKPDQRVGMGFNFNLSTNIMCSKSVFSRTDEVDYEKTFFSELITAVRE